jgi:hypothetical protein
MVIDGIAVISPVIASTSPLSFTVVTVVLVEQLFLQQDYVSTHKSNSTEHRVNRRHSLVFLLRWNGY